MILKNLSGCWFSKNKIFRNLRKIKNLKFIENKKFDINDMLYSIIYF